MPLFIQLSRGTKMQEQALKEGSIQNGEIFTHDEAAQYLGVSRCSLRESRQTNKLYGRTAPKHIRLNYRTVIYKKSTLDDWINALEEFESGAEANSSMFSGDKAA